MTAGTVRLMISTRRTEKGTRTESEIMSPEDCEACAVGIAGNWGIESNDIHNICDSNHSESGVKV